MNRSKRSFGCRHAIASCLVILSFSWPSLAQAETCGNRSPTFPTPEFFQSVRLWPSNFRPALPGLQLPLERDSSQYNSQTFPSQASGHEQFTALDIVYPTVFIAYNAGVSAWDVSGLNAEEPARLHFRDGIAGQWLTHPPPGEADGYIHDIAALAVPGDPNTVLVAVAATAPVGVTLWRFSRIDNKLVPIYQQTFRESHDVSMLNVGGTIYAFFASTAGSFVLDVSAASAHVPPLTTGCLDSACPSAIYRGKIGSSLGSRYISAMIKNGSIYTSSSYGGIAPSVPQAEIWELSSAATPTSAIRRFVGTVKDTHSPTIIKKGGAHYQAQVEAKRLKIYPIDDCLDSSGCSALPTPVYNQPLRDQNWLFNYLTYSENNGTPMLYYGMDGSNLSGGAVEQLLDLTNLGGSNVIPEITASGSTYSDNVPDQCIDPVTLLPVTHSGIGYWSHQYNANRYGLRNFSPRKGMFTGNYFYRVTMATFDAHVRGTVAVTPTVTVSTATPPPFWFGEGVSFNATSTNCTGPESWTWFADDTNATGLGDNDGTATINWNLCTSGDCSDKSIEVWALKDACESASNLVENRVTVTVSDPRPRIRNVSVSPVGNPPNEFPICSVLTFGASIDGKTPFTYRWQAKDVTGQIWASGSGPTLVWNTEGVPITTELFEDGFESGDVDVWDATTQAPAVKAASSQSIQDYVRGSSGLALFNIELTATNPNGQVDTETKTITLTDLGLLQFGSPQITATNQGNGQYRFVANTESATSWRWEFEDPANGTVGACRVIQATRCAVIEAGADDNDVTYRWLPNNTDGSFRVAVQADNCVAPLPISSNPLFAVSVTGISTPNPPAISEFRVNPTAWDTAPADICELDSVVSNTYFCHINRAIPFIVTATNATHIQFDWNDDGTFEDEKAVGSTITFQYGATGILRPKARAKNGATLGSTFLLAKNMTLLN
jgi:hypothetical protein